MPRQRATTDIAYERVLSNLKTAQTFVGHALTGLPASAPPYAVAAVRDVRDELLMAVEMAEEAQSAALLNHLELLADALATPGEGS